LISDFTIIAFTHKTLDLKDIGCLSLPPEKIEEISPFIKEEFRLEEFFLLSTCNRVEFIFLPMSNDEREFDLSNFIRVLNAEISEECFLRLLEGARKYQGVEAMRHLLRVSCSLDSMVVGEKEILAQLRLAYENAREKGYTQEVLRLVMDRVVKAAKEVYTHTKISERPISVVSIAFRKLESLNLDPDSGIILVGSGKTNTLFSKYLVKHGFKNFHIFNRTLSNAKILAREIGGHAYTLQDLPQFKGEFSLLVVCADADKPLIDQKLYTRLVSHSKNPKEKKVLIDLSLPSNIEPEILQNYPNHFIDIKSLQELASRNMDERYKELFFAEKIIEENLEDFNLLLKTRKVELAMKEVPKLIKEIKDMALSTIFAKDIDRLDASSKETLEKVLNYMEKKYISIPMVLAKEILVKA